MPTSFGAKILPLAIGLVLVSSGCRNPRREPGEPVPRAELEPESKFGWARPGLHHHDPNDPYSHQHLEAFARLGQVVELEITYPPIFDAGFYELDTEDGQGCTWDVPGPVGCLENRRSLGCLASKLAEFWRATPSSGAPRLKVRGEDGRTLTVENVRAESPTQPSNLVGRPHLGDVPHCWTTTLDHHLTGLVRVWVEPDTKNPQGWRATTSTSSHRAVFFRPPAKLVFTVELAVPSTEAKTVEVAFPGLNEAFLGEAPGGVSIYPGNSDIPTQNSSRVDFGHWSSTGRILTTQTTTISLSRLKGPTTDPVSNSIETK